MQVIHFLFALLMAVSIPTSGHLTHSPEDKRTEGSNLTGEKVGFLLRWTDQQSCVVVDFCSIEDVFGSLAATTTHAR